MLGCSVVINEEEVHAYDALRMNIMVECINRSLGTFDIEYFMEYWIYSLLLIVSYYCCFH